MHMFLNYYIHIYTYLVFILVIMSTSLDSLEVTNKSITDTNPIRHHYCTRIDRTAAPSWFG